MAKQQDRYVYAFLNNHAYEENFLECSNFEIIKILIHCLHTSHKQILVFMVFHSWLVKNLLRSITRQLSLTAENLLGSENLKKTPFLLFSRSSSLLVSSFIASLSRRVWYGVRGLPGGHKAICNLG